MNTDRPDETGEPGAAEDVGDAAFGRGLREGVGDREREAVQEEQHAQRGDERRNPAGDGHDAVQEAHETGPEQGEHDGDQKGQPGLGAEVHEERRHRVDVPE